MGLHNYVSYTVCNILHTCNVAYVHSSIYLEQSYTVLSLENKSTCKYASNNDSVFNSLRTCVFICINMTSVCNCCWVVRDIRSHSIYMACAEWCDLTLDNRSIFITFVLVQDYKSSLLIPTRSLLYGASNPCFVWFWITSEGKALCGSFETIIVSSMLHFFQYHPFLAA